MTHEQQFDFVLSHFRIDWQRGNKAMVYSPLRNEKKASVSFTLTNEEILFQDFGRGDKYATLEAVGLTMKDLFFEDNQKNVTKKNEYWRGWLEKTTGKKIEAVYRYSYYDGNKQKRPPILKVRFKVAEGEDKDITYGTEQDGKFKRGLKWQDGSTGRKGVKAVFGNVSKVKKAAETGETVYIPEGEKDVQTCEKHGLAAFTAGGAQEWQDIFKELVIDCNVIILQDNDSAGEKLTSDILKSIEPVVKSVKVIVPVPDTPKADISNYFQTHTDVEFKQMIAEAQEIKRAAVKPPKTPTEPKTEQEQIDLYQFVFVAENGKITGVNHNAIYEFIKNHYSILVISGVVYIYRNGVFLADVSGAKLKTIIRNLILPNLRKSPLINNIFNLFLQDEELEVDFAECNLQPPNWINFQNGYYNLTDRRMEKHSPRFKTLNQIPHSYDPTAKPQGKSIEAFLKFAVPDRANREMFLQYGAICMTRDTAFQVFLVLTGLGGSGKSTLLSLLCAVIGDVNISNVSLDELGQKFASFGLVGKLLNCCADLDIEALADVKLLKQASGEDRIRTEQKGHDAFFYRSTAKMIFSTNELPLIKNERTNAVYRRLLVLPMNQVPTRRDPHLMQTLQGEIDYFIHLLVEAGERLYQNGNISVSDESRAAVAQLWRDSDTVQAFLDECCVIADGARSERAKLYDDYKAYCETSDRQYVTRNNFYKSMRVKGYRECKSMNGRFFEKVALKSAVKGQILEKENTLQEQDEELPFH